MNHVITLIQLMRIASHLELTLGQTSLCMIEGEKLFVWVAMYVAPKYELGTLFLRLWLETGQLFYMVIDRTTRTPCRLQDKCSTFFSRSFRSSLGGWDEDLLCWVICACWCPENFVFLCWEKKPCCLLVCHYSLFSQARIVRESKMVSSGE